jgi:hypothetical protein
VELAGLIPEGHANVLQFFGAQAVFNKAVENEG